MPTFVYIHTNGVKTTKVKKRKNNKEEKVCKQDVKKRKKRRGSKEKRAKKQRKEGKKMRRKKTREGRKGRKRDKGGGEESGTEKGTNLKPCHEEKTRRENEATYREVRNNRPYSLCKG